MTNTSKNQPTDPLEELFTCRPDKPYGGEMPTQTIPETPVTTSTSSVSVNDDPTTTL